MQPSKHSRVFLLGLAAALLPLAAAAESSPAEVRLRDALRQLTTRVQTAEAEAATLRAQQADSDAKIKSLTDRLDQVTKDAAATSAAHEKTIAETQAALADRDTELARSREALEKWKAGYAQLTETAKKTEALRAGLAEKAAHLEQRGADLARKNLELYTLAGEVLTRLQNFSYGRALAAREPFVGTMRVKLENEVQGYKDRLVDPKLKP